jgi:uncharacterized SAM-binding protein YcdF (DUF218 family)
MWRGLLEALVIPPLPLFLAMALGLALAARRRRAGLALFGAAFATLVLLCVPLVSANLLRSLQSAAPLAADTDGGGAQAIVLLSADAGGPAPELGGAGIGPLSLERARYAAHLARATGLPVLTSGGVTVARQPPLGRTLARLLEDELDVPVRWVEDGSGDTRANARRSAAILLPAGVRRVLLVTHAWHMPRARAEFVRAGLEVVPAPTGFRAAPALEPGSFVPSARSLRESAWALHEWIGRAWYAVTA